MDSPCPAQVARRLTAEADIPGLLVRRAHQRARWAAEEGRRRADLDFFEPEERAARAAVADRLRKDGYMVRRRRWPLRWIVDGLVLSW